MNVTKTFKQFQPMIESAAWQAHKHYHIEIEDLRSQAYLVFCEAIERYDSDKASFSTHLFSRLRTVKDYASQEQKKKLNPYFNIKKDMKETEYISKDHFISTYNSSTEIEDIKFELFEAAMDRLETSLELSEDAQDILNFIIGREWETPGINRVPRLFTVKKYYKYWKGWGGQRVEKAWKEIRNWWRSGNCFLQEA